MGCLEIWVILGGLKRSLLEALLGCFERTCNFACNYSIMVWWPCWLQDFELRLSNMRVFHFGSCPVFIGGGNHC